MKFDRVLVLACLLISGSAGRGAAAQKDVRGLIDAALGRMAGIEQMEPYKLYTVQVDGAKESGPKEFFIGLRTGAEVLESRYSSGCSDYAAAFYKLMKDAGLNPVFIIGTEMSFGGLLDNFTDHTGVAVPNGAKWILVDPTKRLIVTDDWAYDSSVYADRYYIGYKGPLEGYAGKGPVACKEQNRLAILKMPPRLLNDRIPYLEVYADDTMKNSAGKENIQVRLVRETLENFYKSHNLTPSQKIKLRVTRDPDRYATNASCSVKDCSLALGVETIVHLETLAWAAEGIAAVAEMRKNSGGLARFDYEVDASMKKPGGTYANPNLGTFLAEAGELYDALGLGRENTVKVTVVNGGENANTGLAFVPGRGWLLSVGAQSGMTLALHRYVQDVYKQMRSAADQPR